MVTVPSSAPPDCEQPDRTTSDAAAVTTAAARIMLCLFIVEPLESFDINVERSICCDGRHIGARGQGRGRAMSVVGETLEAQHNI
jgi:hypothetical protein